MASKASNVGDNQTTICTEEYGNKGIAAGKLDEKGINFTFDDLKTAKGKNGEFWIIKAYDEKGLDLDVLFSSTKLHKAIMANFELLKGAKINLAGVGQGFDREYRITIMG